MTDPLPRVVSTPARLILGGLAPIPFLAVVILQAAVQPGYSHVAHPISRWRRFRLGGSRTSTSISWEPSRSCTRSVFHFAIYPTRRGVIGPTLLGLSGVGADFVRTAGLAPCAVDGIAAASPGRRVDGVRVDRRPPRVMRVNARVRPTLSRLNAEERAPRRVRPAVKRGDLSGRRPER